MISDPSRWTPFGFAADSAGQWSSLGSEGAVRFSAFGALLRVTRGSKPLLADAKEILSAVEPHLFDKLTSGQQLTYSESLELFDRAIAALRAGALPAAQRPSGFVRKTMAGEEDVPGLAIGARRG